MRAAFGLLLIGLASPVFAVSLTMWPDPSGPTFVGERVIWDAGVEGASGEVWYRYRVRGPLESGFRTVRDFSPTSYFVWTPVATEGTYEVEVSALDRATGEVESVVSEYQVSSRIVNNETVITPTDNELVFLFSAPACSDGARTSVEMEAPDGAKQFTHWMDCAAGQSTNVYLAGMRAATEYKVRQHVTLPDGSTSIGPTLTVSTSALSISPATSQTVVTPSKSSGSGVLLQSKPFDVTTAIDMDGNVVWYTSGQFRYLTRPVNGGYFLVINDEPAGGDADQWLRLIDLVGDTVWETNAGAVNAQLERMGMQPMTSFHHEARVLDDGRILVLAGTERILGDVQGAGEIDVLGDMILILDRDLQVQWAWDAFDQLDATRPAILGEVCRQGTGGCPVFRLADVANDWLHGNSLQLTPDGNILYSARHQDWVIKIDYENGKGSGAVIWRMGPGGDFQVQSADPWPWFSHQHDPSFISAELMAVFDNGNTRQREDASAESRGQVFRVDEAQRSVAPVLNVNLGGFSLALGSAQSLGNGNFHFDLGWISNGFSQAIEVDPNGTVVSRLQTETQQYRSFRMLSMYEQ
jgi:hypothetical protein